jgi:hypothetical protein
VALVISDPFVGARRERSVRVSRRERASSDLPLAAAGPFEREG